MKRMLIGSAAAVLAVALVVPAFAGDWECSHSKSAAASADAQSACASHASAWSGAWLRHMPAGEIVVADVAKGSPAAKSGLRPGDVVVAVNGYRLSDEAERAQCASKSECTVGKSVTYTVRRGASTKSLKLTLARMPANATTRFASRRASFDPALAAAVISADK